MREFSTSFNELTPDAAADALSMRTARAIKGNKRRLAELTRVARTAALLATVRTMRISMKGDAHAEGEE